MTAAYRSAICVRVVRLCVRRLSDPCTVKQKHESELARVLDVAPPQAYERGADGKRAWWRRALELFSTFSRKRGDALTREDVAEYRKQKAREELPVTDPERHLGLRVSRLEDLAKGLVVDGDVDVNDLGDNFEIKDGDFGTEPNTGYSIHSPSDARNHERPNHLRCSRKGGSRAHFGTGTRTPTTLRAYATWSGATSRRRKSSFPAGTRPRRKRERTAKSAQAPTREFFRTKWRNLAPQKR